MPMQKITTCNGVNKYTDNKTVADPGGSLEQLPIQTAVAPP